MRIGLLGPLQVASQGRPCALPASRKTRALLAYLAASPRPQRREKLCELFWDLPDDPRGALRWSLSRLRAVLDEPGAERLIADRETVALDPARVSTDLADVAAAAASPDTDPEALERAAALFRGPFLADLELPACPAFQSWLAAMREAARGDQARLLKRLIDLHSADPERALPFARGLVEVEPYEDAAWAGLVGLLQAAGKRQEAADQHAIGSAMLRQAGVGTLRLDAARRGQTPAPLAPAGPAKARTGGAATAPLRQTIRFCQASDGVRIAWAEVGQGPPLVKTANWLNHLEYDWDSPIWGRLLQGLAQQRTLIRYDARGNGLSDREVDQLSLDAWVSDLEAVVDAAGLDRFPLLGVSQGCSISIAYAARHPERVSHLILYGGFALGGALRQGPHAEAERRQALTTLIRHGWGQASPAFRQIFTSTFIPEATPEQAQAFDRLQRQTASPEGAARHFEASGHIDVRALLAKVQAPTLVMHVIGDLDTPIDLGREMAAGIPGARFIPLPGRNHLFLEQEPAAKLFFEELELFLADQTEAPGR